MYSILAKWLFPAIFVGVAFFLVFFLVQVNQNDASIYADKADIPLEQNLPNLRVKEKWIERFSEHEDEGYFYPVTEIFVEVDLKDQAKKTKIYQLYAGDIDPYLLSCLKKVLKPYTQKYMFEQKKDTMNLIIYSKNVKPLNTIVETLKNYDVSAKIKTIIR